MGERGREVALAPCYVCENLAAFDPDEAPSLLIDPATNLPGDHPDAVQRPVSELVREPVCDGCADEIEAERARRGLPVAWPRRKAKRDV